MAGGIQVAEAQGVYSMSAADYHADPCPSPSLSSSLARILLAQSPRHARHAHPRLNPAYVHEESERFDLGTAAHAYLLEGAHHFAVIDAPDWRTKKAKEERDAARAAGLTPILAERWVDVIAMGEELRTWRQSFQNAPLPFTGGRPEQTLVWREGDVWCRARLDWLHDDHLTSDDYKTSAGSAEPDAWIRGPLYREGYDVQAAFYLRGIKAVFGTEAQFRFIVQENEPPYAVSVIALDPMALDVANRKVSAAIAAWRECLARDEWPGYPTRTCYAEAPAWIVAQQEAREMLTRSRDDGRPLAEQMMGGSA